MKFPFVSRITLAEGDRGRQRGSRSDVAEVGEEPCSSRGWRKDVEDLLM